MAELLDEVQAKVLLSDTEAILELLDRADVSISRLARDLKKNRVTVSRWLRGVRVPAGDDAVALVDKLAAIKVALGERA